VDRLRAAVRPVLFSGLPLHLVMFAGLLVLSRLTVISEGLLAGRRRPRRLERSHLHRAVHVPPGVRALWLAGVHGFTALIASLLLADCATASLAWWRLARGGFFGSFARPSVQLARRVAAYGMRGQVGGIMSQLNLRLDFILLTVLTGPAVLGVYAVASKFAELIRVLGMALQYVFYPKFARKRRCARWTRAEAAPEGGLLSAAC
jgi:O-antigen/teichoic acid export membrane protein